MTLPEAREALLALAATLSPKEAREIQRIIKEGMYRRKGVIPTPPKSRRMTKGVVIQIRALHFNNPALSEQDIAAQLSINPGRVSEALIGKRT